MKDTYLKYFRTIFYEGDYSIFQKIYLWPGLVGLLSHPVFYFICKYMGFTENIYMRILASLSYIPFLFKFKNELFHKKLIEFGLAYSLPFLFMFMCYMNNQNLYWKMSIVFAGIAYGTLSVRIITSITIFPLASTLAFFAYNYFVKENDVSLFFQSLHIIIAGTICSLLLASAKLFINIYILNLIDTNKNEKSISEYENVLKNSIDKTLLEKKLQSIRQYNLINNISSGLYNNFSNTLNFLFCQIQILKKRSNRIDNQIKLYSMHSIFNDAANLLHYFKTLDTIEPPSKQIINIDELLYNVKDLLVKNNLNYDSRIIIELNAANRFTASNYEHLKIAFYNIFHFILSKTPNLKITIVTNDLHFDYKYNCELSFKLTANNTTIIKYADIINSIELRQFVNILNSSYLLCKVDKNSIKIYFYGIDLFPDNSKVNNSVQNHHRQNILFLTDVSDDECIKEVLEEFGYLVTFCKYNSEWENQLIKAKQQYKIIIVAINNDLDNQNRIFSYINENLNNNCKYLLIDPQNKSDDELIDNKNITYINKPICDYSLLYAVSDLKITSTDLFPI